jgi:hypothetical protein
MSEALFIAIAVLVIAACLVMLLHAVEDAERKEQIKREHDEGES